MDTNKLPKEKSFCDSNDAHKTHESNISTIVYIDLNKNYSTEEYNDLYRKDGTGALAVRINLRMK